VYDCQNQSLTSVPTDISLNVTAIDLSDNEIVDVKGGDFKGMRSLKAIYLCRNKISRIKKHAFQHLSDLCILDISSNQLRRGSIEKGTFKDMNSLRVLRITNNPFPSRGFPDDEIQHLVSLRNLSMSATKTLQFSSKFKALKNLTMLEIDSFVNFQLNNKSFENLAELSIEYVHFIFSDYCPCTNINEDLFWAFANMKGLWFQTLCGMKYALKPMKRLQFKTLNYLNFSHTFTPSGETMILNENDVKYLRNVCAKTVSLTDSNINRIDTMKSSIFMNCIDHIDLSKNMLRNSLFMYAIIESVRIKFINISYQSYCGSNSFPSTNHKIMYQQSSISSLNLTVSPSLEVLDISNTRVNPSSSMPNIHIIGTNLRRFDISYTSFPLCEKANIKLFFPRLWFLDLSGVQCRSNDFYVDFLKNLHSLSELYMSNVNRYFGLTKGVKGEFLKGLTQLEVVDFSQNDLKELHPKLFQSQSSSLKTLLLNDNLLTTIPTALRVAKSLHSLQLRSNKMSFFSTESIVTISNLKSVYIDVRGNPFDCSCNAIDSLHWMSRHGEMFLHLNKTYCIEDSAKTFLSVLDDLRSLELKCVSRLWMQISISAVSFTFLFLVVITILYRYRIILRYGILRIRLFWRKGFSMITACDNHISGYDAYVSYSPRDFLWVRSTLFPALDRENLRIALQDKNFDPGNSYAEEIVKFINMSKFVIFVITRHFIKSEWGSYEIQVAKIHAIHTKAKLILIIKDGIQIEELPNDILFIWWKIKPLAFNENETEAKQAKFFKRLITTIKD
jgi:Leucine-rich repeat (LRR) protein